LLTKKEREKEKKRNKKVKSFNKLYISNNKSAPVLSMIHVERFQVKKISDLFSRSANNKQDYLLLMLG